MSAYRIINYISTIIELNKVLLLTPVLIFVLINKKLLIDYLILTLSYLLVSLPMLV